MTFLISPQAESDLHAIWDYIAEDNIPAADRLIEDFHKAFLLVAQNPKIGHYQEALRKYPFRFWPVRKRYQVIYIEGPPVQIARILSGYQDIFTILTQEGPSK